MHFMKYLDFLFYKYYKHQIRVGNEDIAPFLAVLAIAFTVMLYCFSFFFFIILLPKQYIIFIEYFLFKVFVVLLIFCFLGSLFYRFFYKNKYKRLLKFLENKYSGKKSFLPLLFPLIGFLLLNIGMFLKLLQNQGKL